MPGGTDEDALRQFTHQCLAVSISLACYDDVNICHEAVEAAEVEEYVCS